MSEHIASYGLFPSFTLPFFSTNIFDTNFYLIRSTTLSSEWKFTAPHNRKASSYIAVTWNFSIKKQVLKGKTIVYKQLKGCAEKCFFFRLQNEHYLPRNWCSAALARLYQPFMSGCCWLVTLAAQVPKVHRLKEFQGGYSNHIWDFTARTGCSGMLSRLTARFKEVR